MQKISNVIIFIFKGIAFLIGLIALVGGGFCAAMGLPSLRHTGLNGDALLYLIICLVLMLIGWFIIKAIIATPKTPAITLSDIEDSKE
ncbi:MAG: hypothetical protein HOP21_06430 [Methylotenera sp.]|nr:hypothetical protein [Methylotenera sp.]